MQASMVASFVVFILTGFYTFSKHHLPFHCTVSLEILVYSILTLNACYFFYVEAYTESDDSVRKQLKTIGISEWWLRVLAQILLFFLWFSLEYSWQAFLITFVFLYVTYIAWDMHTWDALQKPLLAFLDLFGAFLALALLLLMGSLSKQGVAGAILKKELPPGMNADKTLQDILVSNPNDMLMLGFVTACFLAIVICGILIVRFNPFKDFVDKIS